LRATLSNMVLLSTGIRALVFAVGGLMLKDGLLMFALMLPFALAGLWLGNRIHGRISREAVARVMSVVLLLIGASLLVRAFSELRDQRSSPVSTRSMRRSGTSHRKATSTYRHCEIHCH